VARGTEHQAVDSGLIRDEDFAVIMAQAFATYGLSVVMDRALPDARDGMKPVQRRILAGMRESRFLSDRPTVKSAEVVGVSWATTTPTAILPCMTRRCAWPSRSACATR
jgi:DNA gyrase subunit A